MTRGPDIGTMLTRALTGMANRAGCAIGIAKAGWTAWESATFSGARHVIEVTSDDAGFPEWLAGLPEATFALRGHLVADLVVEAVRREGGRYTAIVAALTVAES